VAELLVQTTLRISEQLKSAAEEAAVRDSTSFSNYVCRAVGEKLARDAALSPTSEANRFAVLIEFDLPTSMTPEALAETAQVITTKLAATTRDTGTHNISSKLMAVLPPP
jgi:hypothetical protein